MGEKEAESEVGWEKEWGGAWRSYGSGKNMTKIQCMEKN